MGSYFRYISLNFFKKRTTWLSAIIFWVYLALVLLIIPAILKVGPLSIWNNSIMDVSSYTIILIGSVCAALAVVIFRDGREDGSELIIISKPISRSKIIAVKFIAFFTWSIFIVIIGLIIISLTYSFGKVSADNPAGIDYAKMPPLILATFVGSIINVFLLGAVAIMISMVSGKVGIMVGTIGITIFMNLFYIIAPSISTDVRTSLQDQHGVDLKSCRMLDRSGKQENVMWKATNTEDGKTAYEWAEIGTKSSSSLAIATVNVEEQICQIFKSFGVEDNENTNMQSFGSSNNRKFNVDKETYLDDKLQVKEHDNKLPIFSIIVLNSTEINTVRFNFIGTNLTDWQMYSVLGQNSNSIGMNMVFKQDIGGKFYSWEQLNIPLFAAGGEMNKKIVDTYEHVAKVGDRNEDWFRKNFYEEILTNSYTTVFHKELVDATADEINLIYLNFLLQFDIILNDDFLGLYGDYISSDEKFLDQYSKDGTMRDICYCSYLFGGLYPRQKGFYGTKEAPTTQGGKWAKDPRSEIYFSNTPIDNIYSLKDIYKYNVERMFSSENIIIFWSIVSIALCGLAIIVYTKTDFK